VVERELVCTSRRAVDVQSQNLPSVWIHTPRRHGTGQGIDKIVSRDSIAQVFHVDVVFLGRRAGVPHKTRFLVVLLLENVTQLRVVIGVGISRGDEVPVGQNLWGILLVVGTLGKDKAWR
jgi:hypothetical protein